MIGFDPGNDFTNEACPIFKRSTEFASSVPCGQKFVQEIPVALFQVYEVEADSVSEICGRDITIHQSMEFAVGD